MMLTIMVVVVKVIMRLRREKCGFDCTAEGFLIVCVRVCVFVCVCVCVISLFLATKKKKEFYLKSKSFNYYFNTRKKRKEGVKNGNQKRNLYQKVVSHNSRKNNFFSQCYLNDRLEEHTHTHTHTHTNCSPLIKFIFKHHTTAQRKYHSARSDRSAP